MDVQRRIGEKIRMYRKLRGMSLEELAAKIYKSKSILSKYELGESIFDMDTLYKISEALDIQPAQLFEARTASAPPQAERYGIFSCNTLHAYMLVRERTFRLVKSLFVFNGDERNTVMFYMQIPDFEHYADCKVLYAGQLICHTSNAVIHLTNQADQTDHAVLCTAVRTGRVESCMGLMMMSGYATNEPGALKTLLTRAPVLDEEELVRLLTINRDDFSSTRNSNIFGYRLSSIDQEIFR